MTGPSESSIVMQLADQECQRICRKVIRDLQQITDAQLSGEDSGLANAWDEICVQLQGEQSYEWDAYDTSTRSLVADYVDKLPENIKHAIWLQTPEGQDWYFEETTEREADPGIGEDHINEYILSDYVYTKGNDWSNQRIRAYIDRGYE